MPLTLITLLLTTLLCSFAAARPPGAPDAGRFAPAVLSPVTSPCWPEMTPTRVAVAAEEEHRPARLESHGPARLTCRPGVPPRRDTGLT